MLKALAFSILMATTGPAQLYQKLGSDGVVIPSTTFGGPQPPSFVVNRNAGNTMGLLMVYIEVTDADDSVTAITMNCAASPDLNTTNWFLQTCTVSGATATCVMPLTFVTDPSGLTSPKRWMSRVDIEGVQSMKCVFTNTGGTAADSIRVLAALSTKG